MNWNCFRRRMSIVVVMTMVFIFSNHAFAASQVLVFGGTGRLGSDISKALQSDGYHVTVFARATSDRSRLEGFRVKFVTGDVLDEKSVAHAMQTHKYDVVIDALSRGGAPAAFYADSMANIAKAAAANHVQQVILHGSVGAGDSMPHFQDNFSRGMMNVMNAKTKGEDVLQASGVPYTLIRNWAIKPYGTPPTGQAQLLEDRSAHGWITRADLAALTLQCILQDSCMNKIFHAVDRSPAGQ